MLKDKLRAMFGGLPGTYWYLWAGSLITRVGGLVIPFLAIYLTRVRGLSVPTAGLVVSMFGVGSLSAAPAGGWLADHLGRRRTLLIAIFLGASMMLLLGFARSLQALAAGTLALGFLMGLVGPVIPAIVADVVAPEHRLRAFGLLYWALNIGFSIAPVLGGILATKAFVWLFVADALTSYAFGLLVMAKIPETRPTRAAVSAEVRTQESPLRDPVLLLFCALAFALAVVFLQCFTVLPLDMQQQGIPPNVYGRVIAINGVLIVALQPFMTEWIKPFPRGNVLALAVLLIGVGFGLGAFSHTPWAFAGTIVIWTLGELMQAPLNPAVVADLAPPHARGRYQGVYLTAWGLGLAVAPALGSWVLAHEGRVALWTGCLVLCALTAAGHLAIAPARRTRMLQLGQAG